ncbi:MAG TPA: hypothetical protein VGM67_16320 [Gemmatimonadaceae bacterium]
MSDPSSSFESASVAAVLAQRSRDDHRELVDDLVALLAEVVPGVQVKRALLRRHVQSINIPLGEFVYALARAPDGSFHALRMHTVRGVAIRSDPMAIDEFLAELGPALDAELRRTERGRAALAAWLNSTNS